MKTLLSALILVAILTTSCKKNNDSSQPQQTESYSIQGIRDVSITPTSSDFLALNVTHLAGSNQESVTLTIEELPSGISASFGPVAGTTNFTGIPDFTISVRFSSDRSPLAAGRYPIKVVGTSASGRRTYAMNLIVLPFNGFTVNGQRYLMINRSRRGAVDPRGFQGITYDAAGPNTGETMELTIYFNREIPNVGPRTLNVGSWTNPNELQINLVIHGRGTSDWTYHSSSPVPNPTFPATVTIVGLGKVAVSCPPVTIHDAYSSVPVHPDIQVGVDVIEN